MGHCARIFGLRRLPPEVEKKHPNLARLGYDVTSEEDKKYNCAAWAAKDTAHWWEPFKEHGVFWPSELPLEDTLSNYISAFETIGFSRGDNEPSLKLHLEKIAIYRDEGGSFMHVARQTADGNWTSKLGELQDIKHSSLKALEDDNYGHVCLIMQRPCGILGTLDRAFLGVARLFGYRWRGQHST